MGGALRFSRMGFQQSRLARISELDKMLRSRGMPPVEEVAKRFGVSRRTIERDLQRLQHETGTTIERTHASFYPYRYKEKSATIQPITVTEGELFHFLLGESALRQYRGSPFEESIHKAYQKIVHYVLDEELLLDISLITDTFHFDPGPITVHYDPSVFKALLRGLRENHTLTISYFTAYTRKETFRQIDPYHIANRSGDWYLLGYCYLKKTVRMFHIGRIKSAQMTNKEFEFPDDFDARAHIARGFGIIADGRMSRVRVRFSPEAAVYVQEKEWHQGQTIKRYSDGSIIISFTTEGLDAVKRWVLSFGGEALVLEPEELVKAIVNESKRIQGAYRGGVLL